jgi:hypothetical protein
MRNATYLDFSLDEYRDRYDRLQAAMSDDNLDAGP